MGSAGISLVEVASAISRSAHQCIGSCGLSGSAICWELFIPCVYWGRGSIHHRWSVSFCLFGRNVAADTFHGAGPWQRIRAGGRQDSGQVVARLADSALEPHPQKGGILDVYQRPVENRFLSN